MNPNDHIGKDIYEIYPDATQVDSGSKSKIFNVDGTLVETNHFNKIKGAVESELDDIEKEGLKIGKSLRAEDILYKDEEDIDNIDDFGY